VNPAPCTRVLSAMVHWVVDCGSLDCGGEMAVNKSSGDDGDDQSFADVLNNLSSGPWRSAERRKKLARSSANQQPGVVEPPFLARQPTRPLSGPLNGSDEWSEPADSASVVRPYTWTRGRTAPVVDLALETLVSTSEHGPEMAMLSSEEHRAVAELCRAPRSVAEVAALLSLPLGVARVLLADMADIGLIVVHRDANRSGDTPDITLMERVLSGLRRL
jgi:Protein of unknown function (DUF742)